ncbi:MAG TPA: phosphatidylserine decarboxylase family protein [Geobacteraceae bacterium]|nr:phosphatidylserine decarboxylase family protein [Geobacteraceae bacterium]
MNQKRAALPVAKEGFPFIAIAVFVTVILGIFSLKLPALLALFVTLFIVYFFRNPEREVPEEQDAVLAPADGVIIYLGKAHEEHLDDEMLKVSIFMSVFNVHVNRVPFSGRVIDIFYKRGKFLDARDDKATFENEQSGIIVETDKGLKLVFVQVAGLIARRIVSYPAKGDFLTRGDRYGLIRFGSRVDVYLPKNTDMRVSIGSKTTAGETVLGCLK